MKGCTALALEPLDPSGLLTDAQRAAWQDEFDYLRGNSGETSCMTYFVSSEVRNDLRRTLAVEGSTFATIRDALTDPIQDDWLGQSLHGTSSMSRAAKRVRSDLGTVTFLAHFGPCRAGERDSKSAAFDRGDRR